MGTFNKRAGQRKRPGHQKKIKKAQEERSRTNFHYVRADDFFKNAQPTSIAEDVRKKQRSREGSMFPDEEELRRRRAWSDMAQRIVGAEGS